jgi:transmembrane sensor
MPNIPPSAPSDEQLEQYLAGALPASDAVAVQQWFETKPHGQALQQIIGAMSINAPSAEWGEEDAQDAWAKVREQLPEAERRHPSRSQKGISPQQSFRRYTTGAAGIFMLLTLLAIGVHRWTVTAPDVAARSYATATGQTAVVTLTDGSRVKLAAQSRLVVANDFGTRNRMLTLDGEAFFEVTQASGKPFIVQTGRIVTRVLGTAFDVRRYATDVVARVTVVSGKVVAGGPSKKIVMMAGHVGEFTDSTGTAVAADAGQTATAWTSGQLSFNDAPVPTIADSTLARMTVTAEFRVNKPAEAMLILKRVLNADITFNGRRATLTSQRVRSSTPTRREGRAFSSHSVEAGK